MMNNAKKAFFALIVFIIIASITANTLALPMTLYEKSELTQVTRGVTHEKITRLTESGWLSINVLRVDLKDNQLEIDSIYNKSAVKTLTTTQRLATDTGAVAAINGGYFEWVSGGGSAIGTLMSAGEIDSAFGETNMYGNKMGSITMSKDLTELLIDYCIPKITIRGTRRKPAEVQVLSYNKKSYYEHRDICVYDRKWGNMSVGASEEMPDIVEMVVADGVVTEFRDSLPAAPIPENGFVAVTRKAEDGSDPLTKAFTVKTKVSLNIELNPSIENAYMHVEGASILLKDGAVPPAFTFETAGATTRNPHTMIGHNKKKDELILVTVDGRQQSSIGVTTAEAADLIKQLGAYSALRLDGGGSTTMVTRALGDSSAKTVNSVSDPSQRAILNAIGIYTKAPVAALRGLVIEAGEYNVFVGTKRQFTVKGYDRYYNPVNIDPSNIVWALSGFEGTIENGLLTPSSAGAGKLQAKVGRIRASVEVKSLAGPSQLILNKGALDTKPGESHTFTVTGRDNLGFSARINPVDVKFSVSDSFGTVENGVFKRTGSKSGYITVEVGGAKTYCTVPEYTSDPEIAKTLKPVKVPGDRTMIVDSANTARNYVASDSSFRFGVYGQAATPATNAENKALSAFAGTINKWLDFGVFVGNGNHSAGISQISKKTIATNEHFLVHDSIVNNSSVRILQLSSRGNGIRQAGKYQWINFLEALKTFDGSDLFVFLQQSPSTFSDPQEAQLLKTVLEDVSKKRGCNVWVFYAGSTDSVWLENGIRYFCTAGMGSAQANKDTGAGSKYLLVTYMDGKVTYEYKPIF